MAFLWYRTDAGEGGHKPTRVSHPWGVLLDTGERYYCRSVTGTGSFQTRSTGRQLGCPVDHCLWFPDTLCQLDEPITAD